MCTAHMHIYLSLVIFTKYTTLQFCLYIRVETYFHYYFSDGNDW